MQVSVRTSDDPCVAAVEQGKDYRYARGQAKVQTFCAGSHTAEGEFAPVKRTAAERVAVSVSATRPPPISSCMAGRSRRRRAATGLSPTMPCLIEALPALGLRLILAIRQS